MKSRISSCDLRIFLKDLTRFAPVWVEYSVFLLVVFYFIWGQEWDITGKYSWFLDLFAFVNAIYGFIVAVGLFGYLADPRECNTVHAFPVRREEYFIIHLLSGFVMAVVPNFLFCLLNISLISENILFIFWGLMLEFTFFYGLAIFSILLTGRKIAAATVYALINWLSVLVLWAVEVIYLPLLPGIELNSNKFFKLCPVLGMSLETPNQLELWYGISSGQMGYMQICALLGVGLMVVSLLLYRRRKLEYAGDFLAVKWLTPVFLFAFSIACGCVLSLLGNVFFNESAEIMLMVGLMVGYFSGLMLMKKNVKVFNLKSIAGAALTAAIVLGSMFVTQADPFHRVEYVPQVEDVAMVEAAPNENYFDNYVSNLYPYHTEDPEVIADLTELHLTILEAPKNTDRDYYRGYYVRYHLKNGQTVLRYYNIDDSDVNQSLRDQIDFYYSQPEAVLNFSTLEELVQSCTGLEVTFYNNNEDFHFYVTGSNREQLLQTLFNDCKSGNMRTYIEYVADNTDNFYINFNFNNRDVYSGIALPQSAEATRALCYELLEKYKETAE